MSENPKKLGGFTKSGSVDAVAMSAELENHALRIARWIVRKMSIPTQEAEDLAHQGLLKYLQISEEKRSEIEDHQAYLYGIIRNEALDRYINKTPYLVSLDDEPESIERFIAIDQDIEFQLLLDDICFQLEPEEQSLLELIIIGFSSREMALKLGISDVAVRQRTARLRTKVKQKILKRKKKD